MAGTAIGREPQREVDDAGHQVVDEAEAGPELLAPVLAQLHRRGADQDREQDQRQHVAEAIAVVADEGAEQVPRHEHLDDRHRRHVRLLRALGDVLRGRAAVFLEQLGPGLGRQRGTRLDHVHHDEAERRRRSPCSGRTARRCAPRAARASKAVELRDARGERREHERDDDEEQHAQEDLPDGSSTRVENWRAPSRKPGAASPISRVTPPARAPTRSPIRMRLASRVLDSAVMSSSPGTGRRPQW